MAFPFYKLFFTSATLLISLYYKKFEDLDRERAFPVNATGESLLPQDEEFDFIIVGGGTAGSVLANKLSQSYEVLLLEFAGNPLPMTSIPYYYHVTMNVNETVHQWTSVRQTHSSFGINDGKVYIAQGKGLGGSTNVNGMSYNRGSPLDYDNWANLTGDDTWRYENLLKYFKKSENFIQDPENDHLGNNGPMIISRNEDALNTKELEMFKIWKETGEELGYGSFDNPNAPQKEGFGSLSNTKRKGRRVSTYDSFLRPAMSRSTLTIRRYSEAKKIDIDDDGKALGVIYTRHGIMQYARVRKEVIVSAGTFNSPLLLMRSGIGPQDQLKKAGIPVKANLPVGQTFQDHPAVFINMAFLPEEPYKFSQDDVNDYLKKGKGPIANVLGIFGQAFITSKEAKEADGFESWPDIQFIMGVNSTRGLNPPGKNEIFFYIGVERPTSYGKVFLDTEDPYNKPLIWDPAYLSTERDIKCLVEGIKIAVKTAESETFKKFGVTIRKEPIEICKQHTWGSDEYWTCYGRALTQNIWHPVGTCPMARDNEGVVCSALKVKGGIKNIRVIDNSIQPRITNANTMSPALMIGQKGADMILKDYPVTF